MSTTTIARLLGNHRIGAGSILGRKLADGPGVIEEVTPADMGAGSVTTVSVVTANGVSGSVSNPTTTPAITIVLGAITPTSVAASGTVTGSNLSGSNTGDETAAGLLAKILTVDGPGSGLDADTLDGHDSSYFSAAGAAITSLTGGVTASGPGAASATVITNANLTGDVTSVGNATTIGAAKVTSAMLRDSAALSVLGRSAGTSGVPGDMVATTYTVMLENGGTIGFGKILGAHIDLLAVGTPNLSAGAVTTAKITDANVTLAKLADMTTASLYYRKSASSGPPEVNTLATLKADLGLTGTNSGDQTITLTGGVTGSGTGSFAATVITNANLTGPVTSSGNATTITANAITTTMITDANVTLPKLAAQADQTVVANTSGGSASPTAVALSSITAGKATVLATARAINGTNFDGSAAITVTAAAGTLTGATLNSTVTASSLTSVGTLASPVMTTPSLGVAGCTSINVNSDGAVNHLFFGTYTPTITSQINVASSTTPTGRYYRIGDQVWVKVRVSVTPTAGAGTATRFGCSLPIASNLGAAADLGGGCVSDVYTSGNVSSDATNDRAQVDYNAPSTAAAVWVLWFMYTII